MQGVLEDLESGERYDVVGARVVVGCEHNRETIGDAIAPADVQIGRVLAPHHFALRCDDGDNDAWRIEDLETANGTIVNGLRVTGDAAIRSGDVIRAEGRDLLFVSARREWRRIRSWLAFAPLTGSARGWRALSLSSHEGASRFDLVCTDPRPQPDHPSVPGWLLHTRDENGMLIGVRDEVTGPVLARLVSATRNEGATLPEAAAVLVLGEIAGGLVSMRSLVDKPNVALGLNNIVITWEGRVRVLAFTRHGALPGWFAPARGANRIELAHNGDRPDVHVYALGCVALELLGHDVHEHGTSDTTVSGPLGAFARRCLRFHMNIDQARAELISIANEIGFYPGSELAALARRLFSAEHAREMELREELALIDEDTARSLVAQR